MRLGCYDWPGEILSLNVKLFYKFCIFLDILKPQFRLFAHQLFHQIARFARFIFINIDADQFPAFGVHRGFFEVFGIHFTKPLKAAHVNFAFAAKAFFKPMIAFNFILAIYAHRHLR